MTKTKEEAENNKKNITNLSSSDLANRVDGLKNKMKVEIFFQKIRFEFKLSQKFEMTKTKEEAENNKKNITNLSSSDLANRVDGLKNKINIWWQR